MKKKIFSLILTGIMSLSLALSSCQYILPKSVISASLNEKGELILTYSDNTTQNVGVVKGEDGKDGKDGVDGKDGQDGKDGLNGENGKDLTACEHVYGDWETKLSPSCTSIGYDTRVCSLCGDLDYQFTNPLGHNYENAKDVVFIPGEQHLVNKTCSLCGDTKILEADHNYDKNGVCACGEITHFIESEEYIEEIDIDTYKNKNLDEPLYYCLVYRWWSIDRSYALILATAPYWLTIAGFEGTPVDVILPKSPTFKDMPIVTISGGFGAMMGCTSYGFRNCTTLKSIYIPDHIQYIEDYAFDGCTALESVRFSENLNMIDGAAFRNCTSLKTLDFKNNNCSISSPSDMAFQNCTSLTEIYTPLLYIMAVSDDDFFTCTALKKIYVPVEHYDTYLKRFKDFPSDLEIIIYE